MIGKHFLVSDSSNHRVKRHYTVANCMEQSAYLQYVAALAKANKDENVTDEMIAVRSTQEDLSFSVTAKNYKMKRGLSIKLNEASLDKAYEIQGPMGQGLQIPTEGTCIAFTGGTGSLVFIDLVAHLVRKNLKLLKDDEDCQLGLKFKFIFYVSFPQRDDAIGLELCQGLQDLCQKRSLQNFTFIPRFSNESKQRWDANFINEQIKIHSHSLKKVWVCGPPVMNEFFDKHFLSINPAFNYEIL